MKKIFLAFAFLLSIAHADEQILSDNWYTLHISPGKPWGYYHEVIALKNGQYFYRYDMTRKQDGIDHIENIGAIAKEDLTPVAFNLNKSSGDSLSTWSAVYESSGKGGVMVFTAQNKKKEKIPLEKGAILESFFPVWIKHNWSKLSSGSIQKILVFSENQGTGKFQTYKTTVSSQGDLKTKNCRQLVVQHIQMQSLWCITKDGILEDLIVGKNQVVVKRANSETDAKKIFN